MIWHIRMSWLFLLKSVYEITKAGLFFVADKSVKGNGIKTISLVTKPDNRVIEGNLVTETSEFTWEDGRVGEIADVHYHNDDKDSWAGNRQVKPQSVQECSSSSFP